jgi:hypothetical protein
LKRTTELSEVLASPTTPTSFEYESAIGATKSVAPDAPVMIPFESKVKRSRDGFVGFHPIIELTWEFELMAATELLPAVIAVDSPVEGTLSVHTGANDGENFVIAVSTFLPTFT